MRIVLNKNMILATGLSYKEGCKALEAAANSPAAKHITFTLYSAPGIEGYELHGRCKSITALFIAEPEDFLIEI